MGDEKKKEGLSTTEEVYEKPQLTKKGELKDITAGAPVPTPA